MKHKFLTLAFLLLFYLSQAQLQRYSFTVNKMGSPFNIILFAKDSATANHAADKSFALVDSLNNILSDYIPASELNQLAATSGSDSFTILSPILFDVLNRSRQAWQKSNHAFDITIGTLSKLWRSARKQNVFPDEQQVQDAKALTGFEKLQLDAARKSAKLQIKGMQLDVGGIAKGYTAQQVIDLLKASNITAALVDAGGDIVTTGTPTSKDGWVIGINVPEATSQLLPRTITIKNAAVATSGDVYQYIEHDGKKYAHIIDPATGYGVTFQRNVTVIASDGATADWLASACSILSIEDAKKLADKMNAALLISHLENGKVVFNVTKSFSKYWNKK